MNKQDTDAKQRETEEEMRNQFGEILTGYQTDPNLLAEVMEFSSQFYQYSPRNAQMIYMQNHGATFCQSYVEWKRMGYSVLKGEHGVKIWVPVETTFLKTDTGKYVSLSKADDKLKELYQAGKIEVMKRVNFKLGTVFDISQTTYPKEKYPELFFAGYSSKQHLDICRGIETYAFEQLHCPILQRDLKSISLRGQYDVINHVISINDRLEDTQRLCTTLHELGHAMLHQQASDKSTAQKEIEADALSIMLQSHYGIQLSDVRKRHFKDHYDQYLQEHGIGTMEDAEVATNEIFSNVFELYRDSVVEIDHYVEKHMALEQVADKEEKMRSPGMQMERKVKEIDL